MESVDKVILQKPIPSQICQLILYISNKKGWVGGFVRELTSEVRLYKHFLWNQIADESGRAAGGEEEEGAANADWAPSSSFFNTREPRVEWYNNLWALNRSPPRNCSIFLLSRGRVAGSKEEEGAANADRPPPVDEHRVQVLIIS